MRNVIASLLVVVACSSSHRGSGALDGPPLQADSTVSSDSAAHDSGAGSAVDPADPGPYAVAMHDAQIPGSATGRTVPATIFVPTGAPSPHALVIVSPGFQMPRTQYVSYAQHLASWGFVVIACDYADTSFFADHQKLADDVSSVIDYALAQPDLAIDPAKIATAGHSLGGDISTLAAADDARVTAVVGWDPVDASNPSVVPEKMASVHAAVAVVGETTDSAGGGMPCAPAADNFEQFYAASGTPALQLTLAGADHMDWVDDPSCAFCTLCTAGTADASLAHTTTRRLNVAWLRYVFDGDSAMTPWLDAPPEAGTSVARK